MASKSRSKKSPRVVGAKSLVPVIPLADRVVVRPLTETERGTKTTSGIIIPDAAQEKSSEGIVVAVGVGKYERGARVPIGVSVGDRVLFGKYGHEEVKVAGQEYFIVSESNILAILSI